MRWYDLIILFLTCFVTIYFHVKCYDEITERISFKFSIKNIFLILILALIISLNNIFNLGSSKAFVSFVSLIFLDYIIFKDSFSKSIIYGAICYAVMFAFEMMLSILLLYLNFVDISSLMQNVFIQSLFSLLVTILPYFIVKINFVKKITKRLYKMFDKPYFLVFLLIIFISSIMFVGFEYAKDFSVYGYVTNLLILISVTFLIIFNFYNKYKNNLEMRKTEVLLNFMTQYEKTIDDDRINRHEMLNNLLILKSFKNKNSKEYSEILDELISNYDKRGAGYKNIYKLPTGLKGIIYYKLNDSINKKIKFNINISKQVSNKLELLEKKQYVLVCKLVGIVLDNALEACGLSKEKILNFDIYKENNKIIISVENSCNSLIDITKIKEKNYSTKGKNRGLGLYIANDIVKDHDNIDLVHEINGKFFLSKIILNNLK